MFYLGEIKGSLRLGGATAGRGQYELENYKDIDQIDVEIIKKKQSIGICKYLISKKYKCTVNIIIVKYIVVSNVSIKYTLECAFFFRIEYL